MHATSLALELPLQPAPRASADAPPDGNRWARLWRQSRLGVLLGPAGSGKSQWLRLCVLPRLGRRASDYAGSAAQGSQAARPRGNSRLVAGERCPEAVLLFDDWSGDEPLTRLLLALASRLPFVGVDDSATLREQLHRWHRETGATFYLALDDAQVLLGEARPTADLQEFAQALMDALSDPTLPLRVMLVARSETATEASLAPWLQALGAQPVARMCAQSSGAVDLLGQEPGPIDRDAAAVQPRPSPRQAEAGHAATHPVALPTVSQRGWRGAAAAVSSAAALLATAGVALWLQHPQRADGVDTGKEPLDKAGLQVAMAGPQMATASSRLSTSTPPLASAGLPAAGTQPRLADAARPSVTTPFVPPTLPRADPAATLAAITRASGMRLTDHLGSLKQDQLAWVGYDQLVAAREGRGPALAIVTPWLRQTLRVHVPARDSLHFVHELAGQRLGADPGQTRAAQTAQALQNALFGTTPAATASLHDARLSLDAPVPEGRRVLALDPQQASTRRALRQFLPGSDGQLAVLSYLAVRADAPAPRIADWAQRLCAALSDPRQLAATVPQWRAGLDLPAPAQQHAAAAHGLQTCPSFNP